MKDGQEALDFLFCTGDYVGKNSQHVPVVILLDLKLPKVDGFEVLKQIKSHEETQLIPIVILTSSKEESDLIKTYQLGANSYIVKPVDFENFSDAINQIGLYWLILNKRPTFA